MNSFWTGLQTTLSTVATAYIAIKTLGGSKTASPQQQTVQSSAPVYNGGTGQTFQYVTLGAAGLALLTALFLLFGKR